MLDNNKNLQYLPTVQARLFETTTTELKEENINDSCLINKLLTI